MHFKCVRLAFLFFCLFVFVTAMKQSRHFDVGCVCKRLERGIRVDNVISFQPRFDLELSAVGSTHTVNKHI